MARARRTPSTTLTVLVEQLATDVDLIEYPLYAGDRLATVECALAEARDITSRLLDMSRRLRGVA